MLSGLTRRTSPAALAVLVIAASHLPMFVAYFSGLARQDHYHFFPFAPAATAWFAWKRIDWRTLCLGRLRWACRLRPPAARDELPVGIPMACRRGSTCAGRRGQLVGQSLSQACAYRPLVPGLSERRSRHSKP